MKYINYKCPVCSNQFNEDDDIVVCPDCGTPHHRECYNQSGKCFNQDKHGTDEAIEIEAVDVKENLNEETDLSSTDKENEDTRQIIEEIIEKVQNKEATTINGKPISFYEAAVRKNQKFYIPHFLIMDKAKKGVSWNAGAFFVPFAWSLYRKMYKLALIILALYIVMFGSVGYIIFSNQEIVDSFIECVQEDPYFYEDIILYNASKTDVSLTEKQMNFNKLTTELELPLLLKIYIYIVVYGVRMIMGIYATNLYYKKLTKNIENVEKLDISEDMKRSLLFRKGGTLPFVLVAIIGFFEWQMF